MIAGNPNMASVKRKQHLIDYSRSEYNFLALEFLFDQLKPKKKYTILDMGPASSVNIDFFSDLNCRLYIEDYYRTRQGVYQQAGAGVVQSLQQYPRDTVFDVILFWDLMDYLGRDELKELISHLEIFCEPGTLLFALSSSLSQVPVTPASFSISGERNVSYHNSAKDVRPSPGYNQNDYKRLLPGFKLHRTFLMSSGMEEHLFIFRGR